MFSTIGTIVGIIVGITTIAAFIGALKYNRSTRFGGRVFGYALGYGFLYGAIGFIGMGVIGALFHTPNGPKDGYETFKLMVFFAIFGALMWLFVGGNKGWNVKEEPEEPNKP